MQKSDSVSSFSESEREKSRFAIKSEQLPQYKALLSFFSEAIEIAVYIRTLI